MRLALLLKLVFFALAQETNTTGVTTKEEQAAAQFQETNQAEIAFKKKEIALGSRIYQAADDIVMTVTRLQHVLDMADKLKKQELHLLRDIARLSRTKAALDEYVEETASKAQDQAVITTQVETKVEKLHLPK